MPQHTTYFCRTCNIPIDTEKIDLKSMTHQMRVPLGCATCPGKVLIHKVICQVLTDRK